MIQGILQTTPLSASTPCIIRRSTYHLQLNDKSDLSLIISLRLFIYDTGSRESYFFFFSFFFFNQLNVVLIWKKKFFKESVLFRICGHFSCWYVKYGTYIFLQLLNLDSDGTSEVCCCCCLEKKERKHQNQIVCDIWLWISFVSVNIVNKAACTLHY